MAIKTTVMGKDPFSHIGNTDIKKGNKKTIKPENQKNIYIKISSQLPKKLKKELAKYAIEYEMKEYEVIEKALKILFNDKIPIIDQKNVTKFIGGTD